MKPRGYAHVTCIYHLKSLTTEQGQIHGTAVGAIGQDVMRKPLRPAVGPILQRVESRERDKELFEENNLKLAYVGISTFYLLHLLNTAGNTSSDSDWRRYIVY